MVGFLAVIAIAFVSFVLAAAAAVSVVVVVVIVVVVVVVVVVHLAWVRLFLWSGQEGGRRTGFRSSHHGVQSKRASPSAPSSHALGGKCQAKCWRYEIPPWGERHIISKVDQT